MNPDEIREKLIAGTIHVIASEGLSKASAKQIEAETGINVVYIYRCFRDKDDLFAKTFHSLDRELIDKIVKALPVMWMAKLSMEERCRLLYASVWRFLLGNSEKCLCYTRYYYSPYFKEYSFDEHKDAFRGVVDRMSTAFREEANVWMLLNHILNVMLDFAVKVFTGAVPDNDDTAEHVFRLLYYSVAPYFKDFAGSDERIPVTAGKTVQREV